MADSELLVVSHLSWLLSSLHHLSPGSSQRWASVFITPTRLACGMTFSFDVRGRGLQLVQGWTQPRSDLQCTSAPLLPSPLAPREASPGQPCHPGLLGGTDHGYPGSPGWRVGESTIYSHTIGRSNLGSSGQNVTVEPVGLSPGLSIGDMEGPRRRYIDDLAGTRTIFPDGLARSPGASDPIQRSVPP